MKATDEKTRVLEENARRAADVDGRRYQVSDPAELFLRFERQRAAVDLLSEVSRFPGADASFLELGCGSGGWLPDFSGWGARGDKLHGVDIDFRRARQSKQRFPSSGVVVSDAASLAWSDRSLDLIVLSTVLSSVLDPGHRSAICAEAQRVLDPGGAIVVHDFRVGNPANASVVGIPVSSLDRLFPGMAVRSRSVGLAPPILRRVAPYSWWGAQTLSLLPWLRTHWVAVLFHAGD